MPAAGMAMNEPASTLPLLVWLSPAFPVGSFAYSHGLEQAVQAGDISGLASAQDWLLDLLRAGGPRNDGILLAAAWRAAVDQDHAALVDINQLALAMASSRERYLETSTQGNAFMSAVSAAWPCGSFAGVREALGVGTANSDVAYPVAVGLAVAGHGIALAPSLQAYLVACISSLASALVRLAVIGQTDAQRLIAALMPEIATLARFAETATLDDLGSAAFRSDLAAMAHETLEIRLFRS